MSREACGVPPQAHRQSRFWGRLWPSRPRPGVRGRGRSSAPAGPVSVLLSALSSPPSVLHLARAARVVLMRLSGEPHSEALGGTGPRALCSRNPSVCITGLPRSSHSFHPACPSLSSPAGPLPHTQPKCSGKIQKLSVGAAGGVGRGEEKSSCQRLIPEAGGFSV